MLDAAASMLISLLTRHVNSLQVLQASKCSAAELAIKLVLRQYL